MYVLSLCCSHTTVVFIYLQVGVVCLKLASKEQSCNLIHSFSGRGKEKDKDTKGIKERKKMGEV
jgi:hypothetical protein